ADVAHPGVDLLRPAGGGPVAAAVAVGAEEAAALHHPARDGELRLRRVEARLTRAAGRVAGDAAGPLAPVGRARRVPVGGPLPDVPRHIREAVAVGRKAAGGRRRAGPRLRLPREVAVPPVREPLPRRLRVAAPDVAGAVEPAACG